MRIERHFTKAGKDTASVYEPIAFKKVDVSMKNPDGSIVFESKATEVPEKWSQVACDVIAQKYFRKAGVARALKKVEENSVPSWLWKSVPDEEALAKLPAEERFGGESSSKQVFDRLAGAWTYWGWKGDYFDTEDDARTFYDEMRHMLAEQMAAPNSPQWFNTGLHWAYGIDGPSSGIEHDAAYAILYAKGYLPTSVLALLYKARKLYLELRYQPRFAGKEFREIDALVGPIL